MLQYYRKWNPSINKVLNSDHQTVELLSFKIKTRQIANSAKALNGFIFMDRKKKSNFTEINFCRFANKRRSSWKLIQTQKLFSQKLISVKIDFLKVTKEIAVDLQPKLNIHKDFMIVFPLEHIWIISTMIIPNTCCVNNVKAKKLNAALKS